LLVTLFLCEQGCLSQPLLYLSGFFDETRDEYYRLLLTVSQKGAWREWIEYFLRGIRLQAQRALLDTQKLLAVYEKHRAELKRGKRIPDEAARILDHIFANPFISTARHAKRMNISYHNAKRGIDFWINAGLLHEATGQQRNKIYVAEEILQIMSSPSLPVNAENPQS